MGKSNFVDSVKKKILPEQVVNSGSPIWSASLSVPSANSTPNLGAQPQSKLISDVAVRLGINEIMPTGGIKDITDIASNYWFGALKPIQPVAPSSYKIRQRAFTPGENYIWEPGDEKSGINFETLRVLADSWDLLRTVIETRKDQICKVEWEVRVKPKIGEKGKDRKQRQANDPIVSQLTDFFSCPDGIHDWPTWLRMIWEDILVLDGGAIYYQRDLEGKIAGVMPIDGATISRNINDMGVTPSYPQCAYQQVVYGSPAADLTVKDLLYIMRNERTHKRYGLSPVEQIIVSIGIGLRRQDFLLQYYVSGNMPEALCFLPSNLPPDRIKEIQSWFDSVLAGNLSKRRRLTFLPGYGNGSSQEGVRPNVIFPKEPLLKDELDDWLMRIVCYAFSVSPQNLMKQMNRASAQESSDISTEEGLIPSVKTTAAFMNSIFREIGVGDRYEWAPKALREVDPLKQAQIENMITGRILTINEVREDRGREAYQTPEADMLGTFTPTGFIPLGSIAIQGQPTPSSSLPKSSTNPPKMRGKTVIPEGEFVHPIYGDLSKYDSFFAYDEDSDTILVKGDCDIDEARKALGHTKMPFLITE